MSVLAVVFRKCHSQVYPVWTQRKIPRHADAPFADPLCFDPQLMTLILPPALPPLPVPVHLTEHTGL